MVIFAAPHRLPFLTGVLGMAVIAAWWAMQLGGFTPQSGDVPGRLLHAPVMLLITYPAFIFGFLLTVFPRWMGQPDLPVKQFAPVSLALALATGAVAIGLWTGAKGLLQAGFLLFSAAWAYALVPLAATIRRNAQAAKPPCWHAVSALVALVIGLLALFLVNLFIRTMNPVVLRWATSLALDGFILPVFLTVAHRMVPFFAGNVVEGYARWRPDWLLAALWSLLIARIAGEMTQQAALAAVANLGLAAITGLMVLKWRPHGRAPGLLNVLIWGFCWAPLGFFLSFLAQAGLPLGLAPIHALALGFGASLMIGMVTRVTNGHSGRPLAMTAPAWIAFFTVQLATVLRIAAALRSEPGALLTATAALFVIGLLPWLFGNVAIYLRPRIDGRAG